MSVLYSIVSFLSRSGFPTYFGRLEINGRENIPLDKPYIIAPNHQNAFMDAVITAVHCPKQVHFLTRSDVFISPFDIVLKQLNMMPVYRRRDGYEKLKKNEEIFSRCYDLLKNGSPVLIFPEGNMGPGHSIRPLTKGTARMAFNAQEVIPKDLYILPVGINYFHHKHPRCKAILNFGSTIRVRDYEDRYIANKAKGLISLRNDLQSAIESQMLIPDNDDQYDDKVLRLNRKNENLNFDTLKKLLETPSSLPLVQPTSSIFKWIAKFFGILNLGPLLLIHKITSNLKEPQFIGSLKFFIGIVAFPIWWAIIGLVVGAFQGAVIGIAIVLCSIIALFIRAFFMKRWR